MTHHYRFIVGTSLLSALGLQLIGLLSTLPIF